MNKIVELFENNNSKELINFYYENKSQFCGLLSAIFVKSDNVKLLKYLDNLNILNDSASTVLFECL